MLSGASDHNVVPTRTTFKDLFTSSMNVMITRFIS